MTATPMQVTIVGAGGPECGDRGRHGERPALGLARGRGPRRSVRTERREPAQSAERPEARSDELAADGRLSRSVIAVPS